MDESSLLHQLRAALVAIETLTRQAEQREREFEALLDATKTLQDDRDRLADLAGQQRKEQKALCEKIAELAAANKELTNQLWGRRSERRVGSDQPLLFPEMQEPSDDEGLIVADMDNDAQAEIDEQLIKDWDARRRKARERRRRERSDAFPDHLERRERVLDLDDAEKAGLKYIGDAISERLRFERSRVYVERIVRRKYVREGQPDAGVSSPPPPVSLVEGGRYGFDVVAAMLAQKYAFHQPTYRQQDWFAQAGWFPSRSTINDMLNHSVDLIGPLFELMRIRLLSQSIIHADETTALLLTRDSLDEEQLRVIKSRRNKKSKPPDQGAEDFDLPGSVTSYVWLFAGLDQFAPYNCFHWSITRSHSVVDDWLNGFRGKVVADGYEAYTNLEKRTEERIVHSSCNVHARREFTKAEIYEPVLCAEATALYRQLYAIEERGKLLDAEGRQKLRQEEAISVWLTFDRWLDSEPVQRAALPASRFGKAVGYMRNQWTSLQRYLNDGNLPIDNNQAEQVIRPLTVGRRNWLFLGHPQAASGRMQLLSVISSAHRHNLMIEDYLADALEKLASATQREPSLLSLDSEYLADLLPDRWAASHPKSIRTERAEEKTDRAEAKRVRRARRRITARRKKQANQAN